MTTRRGRREHAGADGRRRAFPAQVEHKFGTTTVGEGARADRRGRPHRAGHGAGARLQADRHHRVVRRAAARGLAVGAGRARATRSPRCSSAADGFQFEKIAALRPDLIIGVNSGMKQRRLREVLGAGADRRRPARAAPSTSRRGTSRSSWSRPRSASRRRARELVQGVKDDYAEAAAGQSRVRRARPRPSARTASTTGSSTSTPTGCRPTSSPMLGFTINPKLTPLVENEGEQVADVGRAARACSTPT